MAEAALFNIAGGIINGVAGPLVAQEVKLFLGAKGELDKLTNTLSTIKAVLVDAEERQTKNESVKHWLERLSDVLYEADDLLDAVSTEAQRRKIKTQHKKAKRVRIFFSKSNPFVFRLKMAHKIKAVREKLDDIANDMKIFNFVVRPEEPPITVMGRDSTYSFVREEEVIGRDSDKEEIIKRLLDTNVEGNVSILPIVGIGGLGKTTLVQYVYNDEKIQTHFELRMWICVSDRFNLKHIVEKILESIREKKSNSVDVMVNNLKAKIDQKKYLLVLDDVWNEDAEQWSNLERVLIGGAVGSKILVTTRSELVAKIIYPGNPYNLEGLGDLASLNLLKQMAFPNGEWPKNPRFRELGRDIIKKCAGVPLAVKTLGRMLHFKNSVEEWLNFAKSDLPDIENDKFGILSTLKFSYSKLPSCLKHCFAYSSIYPKDYVYDKTTIIQEWIAHGFVEASPINQCLEDVGNNYFMDLLWRSFFQDPEENDDHMVIKYKMHDLMHDLASSVMAKSLITTFDEKEWKINKKSRHLSVCKDLKFSIKQLISRFKKGMIRTFHCPNFGGEIDCEAIFSSFKFLRVMNLSHDNLEHVPDTIGKLKHLRYLDLSWNIKIKLLPRACTMLVNLKFLNLGYCEALTGLPRGIENLTNLEDLNLDGCSNLQWWKQFQIDLDSPSSDNASLSEFKELNKLGGSLIIWNLRHSKNVAIEYKIANIKEKIGLKSLMLHFSSSVVNHVYNVEDEMILEGLQPHANLMKLEMNSYMGVRLPSWISSITGLVELRLYKCHGCQYLPHVNQLHALKELCLCRMNALIYISNSSEFSSFSSLSKIVFEHCSSLKGWWRGYSLDVASDIRLPLFPMLSEVLIEKCPMLASLPLSPKLSSLKELRLKEMDNLEYLFDDDKSFYFSSSGDLFSSLSTVHFEECPNLKGWWRDSSLKVDRDNGHYSEKTLVTSIKGQYTLPLLPKLSKVWICDCPRLTSLPLFPQLYLLKELCLRKMDTLEYLFDDNRSHFSSSSSASTKDVFSSLSKIYFEECPKLKGWWRDSSLEVDHHNGHYSEKATVISVKGQRTLLLFPQLSKVQIKNCPELTSLQLSSQSHSLKEVFLCGIDAWEYIFDDDWSDSSTLAEASFPSLSIIRFERCQNLKGWWKDSSLKVDCTLPLFPKLSYVSITHCPLLTSAPLSPHVESLCLSLCSPKLLQQIMMMKMPAGTSNSTLTVYSSPPLSKLKEILLWKLSDLETLEEEWLKNLTSLESLKIRYCMELKSLSVGIQYLTTLKHLIIDHCPELEPLTDEHGMCWEGLKSLFFLSVNKLLKWVSLPLGLQQVSTLQVLYIFECKNLTTILESINHWKSLEEIHIRDCPRLTKLPEGIQSLSSLRKLEIGRCPSLLLNYQRDEGVEWHKIAHIPELKLL